MIATDLSAQPDSVRGRKILLVEDSDELRELYEEVLTNAGHDVRAAARAEPALELARKWRPDLVITDLFMSGMGGLELITRLRSDLTPPVPPIVVVSGFPDAKPEALHRGATRFETKPLDIEELLRVVRDSLAAGTTPYLRTPDAIAQRRAEARTAGEATLAGYLRTHPNAIERMHVTTTALARFFGHSSMLAFFLRKGKLQLVASSDPRFPIGCDANEILPLVRDVVESNASLLLTDENGGSRWLAQLEGARDIRFVVAIPYVLERAVIGALCLVDRVSHDFNSDALGILEYMARRSAAVVTGDGAQIVADSGALDRAAFEAILQRAVSWAQNAGHAFGFALLEVATVPRDESLTPVFVDLKWPGLMLGVIDERHLAVFVIAESPDRARERLLRTRRELESRVTVTATAELTYEDPIPRMAPESFVARGRELLARAATERAQGRPAFAAMDARRR